MPSDLAKLLVPSQLSSFGSATMSLWSDIVLVASTSTYSVLLDRMVMKARRTLNRSAASCAKAARAVS